MGGPLFDFAVGFSTVAIPAVILTLLFRITMERWPWS
jgi:hypothetical protein